MSDIEKAIFKVKLELPTYQPEDYENGNGIDFNPMKFLSEQTNDKLQPILIN
jgi:hypothetical protein